MLIARQKRKNNIAEYILYMWQIEDLIRAWNFDMQKIEENIIRKYQQPDSVCDEIRDWYKGIINMMNVEKIKDKGHLLIVTNHVDDLNDFHNRLLKTPEEIKYRETYSWAKNGMKDFANMAKLNPDNEIEVCFNAAYALLMLRMQKKEISGETIEAISNFTSLLALLSKRYKAYSEGRITLSEV